MAVLLRTSIVRVTAGSWPKNVGRDQALGFVADCLKRSLDYAEEKGVMLALEDHAEIGTAIEDFTGILDLVNDERLKVNLDTSNPLRSNDSPVELAQRVKHRVVHVHASDVDDGLAHAVAGEGRVPFREIFTVLRSAGFDGWVSLEAGGERGKHGIAQGLKYIKEVWDNA